MTSIVFRICAILALLAALFFAEQYVEGRGYDRARAEDQAAIEQGKREAANKLLRITDRVHDTERALQAKTDFQNLKDREHEKPSMTYLAVCMLLPLLMAGVLWDPNAARCGSKRWRHPRCSCQPCR